MADILSITTDRERALARAVAVLSEGQPVAIPTETVYGLAADATNPDAITRIYLAKRRPRFNPLIAHMASRAMAERHVVFDPLSAKLAEAFWPGALTLILPLSPETAIHPLAVAGLPTAGVRVPKGFARELIEAFGKPLSAPSANISGRISPTTATHVAADLGDRIPLILDGGPCPVGVESTIVKIEGETAHLMRAGGIEASAIEAVIGRPLLRPATAAADPEAGTVEAPGMLASHYAPEAPVRLDALRVEPGEALIRFGAGKVAGEGQAAAVFTLSAAGDLAEAARNLFDTLKRADATGAAAIAVMPIPEEGLGEAINDRLTRAAAPRP